MTENYYKKIGVKSLKPLITSFFLLTQILLWAQDNTCSIRVDLEPNIAQINLPLQVQNTCTDATQNSFLTLADDQSYFETSLDSFGSDCFYFGNVDLNLKSGTEILGLGIRIEGFQGKSNTVTVDAVQFIGETGTTLGENKAGKNVYGVELTDTENSWQYGHGTDSWGIDLNTSLLNSENFGFSVAFSNLDSVATTVYLDKVELIVYYRELYALCDHSCSTFYVDQEFGVEYEWEFPDNVSLASESLESGIINLDFSKANPGVQTICVTQTSNGGLENESCCREVLIDVCGVAQVNGLIWNDIDANGTRDASESASAEQQIYIYDINNIPVDTFDVQADGGYQFLVEDPGFYYLVLQTTEEFIAGPYQIGDPDVDNDAFTIANNTRTDLFYLGANHLLSNIDFGLIQNGTEISGNVFEDLNGDLDLSENANYPNLLLKLFSDTNDLIDSTRSDSLGFFEFLKVQNGLYAIEVCFIEQITFSENYDLLPLRNIEIKDREGQTGKDIYLIKYSTIGDFVWEDINENGLQDEGEPGLANVNIELLDEEANLIQTTISDQEGKYLFEDLFPGNYIVRFREVEDFDYTINNSDVELNSDIISDDGTSQLIIVTSGSSNRNIDGGFFRSTGSISGFVWNDENMDGLQSEGEPGIAGVQINLVNEQNIVLGFIWTNEDGEYEFDHIAFGSYQIVIDGHEGYSVTIQNLDDELLNSDIGPDGASEILLLSNDDRDYDIDIGLLECMAEIGDFVWLDENENGLQDQNEPGIEGVIVKLINQESGVSEALTNSNGTYSFKGFAAGEYIIEFELPLSFSITSNQMDPELNSDAVEEFLDGERKLARTALFFYDGCSTLNNIDLGLIENIIEDRSTIGDFVWNDLNIDGLQDVGEVGINEVRIYLHQEDGSIIDSTLTSNHPSTEMPGHYLFTEVENGEYYLSFVLPPQYDYSPDTITNTDLNSKVTNANGQGTTDLITISESAEILNIDCGMYIVEAGTSTIGDFVWNDRNSNGLQNVGEVGINEVRIYLHQEDGSIIDSTLTSNHPSTDLPGYYLFTEVENGEYYLSFILPPQYDYSPDTITNTDLNSKVTNANGLGTTDLITINTSAEILNMDCGMYIVRATVGDYVWFDLNANGLQDDDESGIGNVKVSLFTEDGVLIHTVFSDNDGFYRFTNISSGAYYLQFQEPAGYLYTIKLDDSPELNSDVDEFGNSPIFLILDSNPISDIDCGLISRTVVGDFVWNDLNKDGLQNNEPGIEGVNILIFDLDDNLIASTVSDSAGNYFFYGLPGAEYYLQVDIPSDFQVTIPNAGNDQIDSDALSNGISENFVLGSNEKIENIDIGLFATTSLSSGEIFHDLNANQLHDEGETGIANIEIQVLDEEDELVYRVFSNALGKYDIGALPSGKYKIKPSIPTDFLTSDIIGSNLQFNNMGISSEFLSSGLPLSDMNFGIFTHGTLALEAWNDINGNGLADSEEENFEIIGAFLVDGEGSFITELPMSEEAYANLFPGTYSIKIPKSSAYYLADSKVLGSDPSAFDNDFFESEEFYETDLFSIESTEHISDIKAGFYHPASIGKMVWLDENENGIQDQGEVGVVDLQVELYDIENKIIDSVQTDSLGYYSFSNLRKGDYFVRFDISEAYEFTVLEKDNPQATSSVVNEFGYGTTAKISLSPALNLSNIDAGVVLNDILFSELLEFQGRRSGAENVLNWTTDTKRPIIKYLLQRRKDGEQEFIEIAEISAIDQEKNYQEYRYLDKNAQEEGNYFYRLKEFDLFGNYAYSEVAVVKVLYDVFTFNVSPNPASEVLNVQFEVAEKSKVTINVLDEAGRRIQSIVDYSEFDTGIYQLPIQVSHYPNGFYILQMTAGHRLYNEKLIIFRN